MASPSVGLAFWVNRSYPCRLVAEIQLEHLTKVYAGGVTAVDDVSLSIGDGEFMEIGRAHV